jgi:formylglycine-generating enzyme required for sulfatase activity
MSRHIPLGRCSAVVVLSSLVALVLLDALQAQTEKGKKYALLVGVRSYMHRDLRDLKYTENDVEELALALPDYTKVVVLTSTRGATKGEAAPTAANIRKQLKALLAKGSKHDTILMAFAGHGLELKVKVKDAATGKEKVRDEGFFCPADAKPRENVTLEEQSKTLLGFTELFRELKESGVGVKLLLVDACRNDPTEGRNVELDSLPRAPKGMAALFACRSGERAFETDKLGTGHSVFFYHVIQALQGKAKNDRAEVTWDRLAEHVKEKVSDDVPVLIGFGAKQTPEEIKKLEGKAPVLVGLTGGNEITNSIGMKLVRIPAGKFQMGSTKAEQNEAIAAFEKNIGKKALDADLAWIRSEGPRHPVEITKDFYLGVHEVTQKQCTTVMGKNPSWFCAAGYGKDKVKGMDTDDFPVESVTWEEAVAFCKKLSALPAEKRAGRKYRLPTEAEWEHACRGGAPSNPFHCGHFLSSKQANFDGNNPFGGAPKGDYLVRTEKVGSYTPNAFGLFDMHGNVAEWCSDWYGKDYYSTSPPRDPQGPAAGSVRVNRGGGWNSFGRGCRSAYRDGSGPDNSGNNIGFRIVLVSRQSSIDG